MRPLIYTIQITLDGCYDHNAIVPDEELHHYSADHLAQADEATSLRLPYRNSNSNPAEDFMSAVFSSRSRSLNSV